MPSEPANRPMVLFSAGALALILLVNVPPFLRTALDCDAILFDLYARDMNRGGLLYRDMIENNTPVMIEFHRAIRAGFGWSSEAIRVIDLLVVGSGLAMLAFWSRRWDRFFFSLAVLASIYLTTSEWCHVQRDVWLIVPIMGGLYLRRLHLIAGQASFPGSVLEGLAWGAGIWLKPHLLVVVVTVWLAGVLWAYREKQSLRRMGIDAVGLLTGGLLAGVGILLMNRAGLWEPYIAHVSDWGRDYFSTQAEPPHSDWDLQQLFVVRYAPWSAIYAVMAILSYGMIALPLGKRTESPRLPLLAAALAGFALQAFFLQHVFDYVHITGMFLAAALLVELLADNVAPPLRRLTLFAVAALAVINHAPIFVERLGVWDQCWHRDAPPELRDRLARYERIGWADLERVAAYLRTENIRPDEINIISDTRAAALANDRSNAPTRYYVVINSLIMFPKHREDIFASLAAVDGQKYVICDIVIFHEFVPKGHTHKDHEKWPFPDCWYGPNKWADRVVYRVGRYMILRMNAREVPVWLKDVSKL